MNKIRVRIAPSPTGNLHIGTARSALFNYLYAKKRRGSFILRIEDTDLERSDKKFEKNITEGLEWLGLKWDEGPKGDKYIGKYAPYRQNERIDIYRVYIEKLLKKNYVYHCFCTQEELEVERIKAQQEGKPPVYSGKCRQLSKIEAAKKIKNGQPSIIRFKMPDKIIEFNDAIRGRLKFETKPMGDMAIAKDINTPLYNLAVVIDDITMDITHVIRGEDHISNTPKQILIYNALNMCHPIFAHLPLILGPDKTKLSKRHGATSVIEFKKQGYLPDAMINFMALMGWNPKDNREFFTLEELESEFDLSHINKSGAIFNIDKLDSINSRYIKKLSDKKYIAYALDYLAAENYISLDKDQAIYLKKNQKTNLSLIKKALLLEKNRIKNFSDLFLSLAIFLETDMDYPIYLLSWKDMNNEKLMQNLSDCHRLLQNISEDKFNLPNIEKIIFKHIKEKGISNGEFLWPMRVALSGKKNSPSPFELADVLGKNTSLQRINHAIKILKK